LLVWDVEWHVEQALLETPGKASLVDIENPVPPAGTPAETLVVKKFPAPDAAAREKALQAIKAQFKADYAAAKKPERKLPLARTLMARAAETKDDPAKVFVLLQEAIQLAAQGGEAEVATEAVNLLSQQFEVNLIELQGKILGWSTIAPKSIDDAFALVARCRKLAEEAATAEEYDVAVRALQTGADSLKKPIFKPFRESILWSVKQMDVVRDAFEAAKPARETLKTNPDDKTAGLAWGRFLCFYRNDWKAGLPLVAKSDDPIWSSIAQRELKAPDDATDLIQLGDDWLASGDKQPEPIQFQTRRKADLCWQSALNVAKELQKPKVYRDVDQRFVKLFEKSMAITLGDPGGFAIPGTERLNPGTQFTIEFWISSTALVAGGVLSKRHADGDSTIVVHFNNEGTTNLGVHDTGGGESWTWGGKKVPDGQWHHMAVVKDGKLARLFLDGQPILGVEVNQEMVSVSPWKLGCSKGRAGYPARFARVRISSVPRYTQAFTPEKFYLKDPETLFPIQKNDF
jgi:hypothetical protein